MSAPASRRGFLRGLTTLPLIGGGVALIGAPSAFAEPLSDACLHSYLAFLSAEFRCVHDHLWPGYRRQHGTFIPCNNAGDRFHRYGDDGTYRVTCLEAAHRAPVVLAAVGCDWREGSQ